MIKWILLATIIVALIIVYVWKTYTFMRVENTSMEPTLHDGGIYLAKKVRRKNKCKVGNIYSFNLNNKDYRLIKRLVLVDGEGCHFKGDNANHSLDSRYFGAVPASHIEYVIISTFDIREWLGQYGCILDNALKAKGY